MVITGIAMMILTILLQSSRWSGTLHTLKELLREAGIALHTFLKDTLVIVNFVKSLIFLSVVKFVGFSIFTQRWPVWKYFEEKISGSLFDRRKCVGETDSVFTHLAPLEMFGCSTEDPRRTNISK